MAQKEEKLNFPDKETRQKCWATRDKYWKCLDDNNEDESKCKQLKDIHESSCPQLWISHYRRQYKYNKFKAKMEKEDFDPIDYFSQEQAKNKKE